MNFTFGHRILRHRFSLSIWRQLKRDQHMKARMVLLPEVPTDTPQTNAFMKCIEDKSLPDFKKWSFKDGVNGVAKLGLEYEGWLLEHFDDIADANSTATTSDFSAVMDPLEQNCVPVEYAWQTFYQNYVSLMFGKKNAENHAIGLQRMMSRLAYFRFSTPGFHQVLKTLCANNAITDAWQRRLCEKYLLECHLNGLDLKPHKTRELIQMRERFEQKKVEYKHHIIDSIFKLPDKTVESPAEFPDAPEHVLRLLADNPDGPIEFPFALSFSAPKYSAYLQYCKTRPARWGLWLSVNSRAAFKEDTALFNNSIVVEELRQIRERQAKWLGYKTYADAQLRICMAKSVDEVNDFLSTFGDKAADRLDALYEDMCVFTEAEGGNVENEPPDAWDLAYYARKVANDKLNHHGFAEYFPYPQTMKNIMRYVGQLFGIEFRDVTATTPVWHSTVEAFEIRSQADDKLLAHLFVDPYSRQGKCMQSFAVEGRPKSDIAGTTPIVYLNMNFTPPTSEKPSLIYFDQLSTMAYELGRALQQALSAAPYAHMAGDSLVEWDCKHVCGRVLELLLTRRPEAMVEVSQHYQNGSKLALETARSHVKGFMETKLPSIVREVVESELDVSMNSTRLFWRDTYAKLHDKYLPYKWGKRKGDDFVCSLGSYVTENNASRYFAVLWAKKIASDIVEAFDEASKRDEIAAVGKRYADLYLINGGKYSQAETFKRFRGRDPMIDPMYKYYVP